MDALQLKDLAKQLREGAEADIFADFDELDEYENHILVDVTQQAMTMAATFLDKLADLVE